MVVQTTIKFYNKFSSINRKKIKSSHRVQSGDIIEIYDISKIENDSYWVMGEYFLSREVGDANGVFMIIFKNILGSWKIVADMSCG